MIPNRDKTRHAPILAIFCSVLALADAGPLRGQASVVDAALDRSSSAIGVQVRSAMPASVLERARKIALTGEDSERGPALLLLGLAQSAQDYELLASESLSESSDIAERATIALGLLGTARARHTLEVRLRDRDAGQKAVTAFALGLVSDSDGSSSTLKVHALDILRRNLDDHSEELTACIAGMPADEGRSVLEHMLRLRGDPSFRRCPQTGRRLFSNVDRSVEQIATTALASRFATAEEWIQVRQALSRTDSTLRYLALLGLERRGSAGLDKKLRAKVARDLERRIGDRDPKIAGLALVTLAKFDATRALRRARRIVDLDRRRPSNLDAAFLVIGKHGTKKDERRLHRWQARAKDAEAHAAWALASADLVRRIDPKAFPPKPSAEARFPLGALRTGLLDMATQPAVVRAAYTLALARLGDKKSSGMVRSMFFENAHGRYARTLATSAMHLDGRALHERRLETISDQHLLGWSLVGTPRLWKQLEEELAKPGILPERRGALLTLAGISIAGPRGDLGARIRARIGDVSLPPTLRRIAGWLDPGRARAMMRSR